MSAAFKRHEHINLLRFEVILYINMKFKLSFRIPILINNIIIGHINKLKLPARPESQLSLQISDHLTNTANGIEP